jgi:hypothetical protein
MKTSGFVAIGLILYRSTPIRKKLLPKRRVPRVEASKGNYGSLADLSSNPASSLKNLIFGIGKPVFQNLATEMSMLWLTTSHQCWA